MTSGLRWISAGGAAGDDAAVVEADDAVGHAHHHLHVVLDQQHGDAERADAGQQLHEARGLGRVHAGHRLVEQQQLRLGGKRDRDLEQPQLAVGQRGRQLLGRAPPGRRSCRISRASSASCLLLARHRRQAEQDGERALLGAQVQADQHVVEHASGR